AGGGGSVAGIDLGGGPLGSRGVNNFRGFTAAASATAGAIVVAALTAQGPVQAQGNLFGVASPETVIFDQNDSATLANVVATGNLTGNAAFVQALYLKFLRRIGDLGPGDAGSWVTQLGMGASPVAVANAIIRSGEALGFVVDDLFRQFLNRDAAPAERSAFVSIFQNGATLEQVTNLFVTSAEYRIQFGSDAAFVQSLYHKLLGRTGSPGEVAAWVNLLPSQGRAGVAASILGSAEYRGIVVRRYYADL